jgi:hypothetical protein
LPDVIFDKGARVNKYGCNYKLFNHDDELVEFSLHPPKNTQLINFSSWWVLVVTGINSH